jgi:hypothetical protein
MWKLIVKRYRFLYSTILLTFIALALQSCLGIGGNSNFTNTSTDKGQVGINSDSTATFNGKIYFTLNHNLYVLDGQKQLRQLTKNLQVYDPTVSPDGKWIAFISRHNNYSDLAYMPTSGGQAKVMLTGAGNYELVPGLSVPRSTAHWYAQPAWSADSKHLLVLSDYMKEYWNFFPPSITQIIHYNNPILDLQLFSIPFPDSNPADLQPVSYSTIGDGGLRDPAYRPGHPDQVMYTGYSYDAATRTHQRIGIYLVDPTAISKNPDAYYPAYPGTEVDPAIEITPDKDDLANLEPVFSPDGQTIAYVRREDATHMGVYTMGVPENVTSNPNDKATQQRALQPYNKSVKLFDAQYISQPVWSPDGKQLIYYNYYNATFDLWLVNVAKDAKGYHVVGSPIQLTSANGQLNGESRPCWAK